MENVKINGESYLFVDDGDSHNIWYEPTLFKDCIEAGKAKVSPTGTRVPESGDLLFALSDIYVSPKFRGNGLASFLLDKVIEHGRKEGKSIKGCIAPQGGLKLEQLTNFYERHGFEVKGREIYWSPG